MRSKNQEREIHVTFYLLLLDVLEPRHTSFNRVIGSGQHTGHEIVTHAKGSLK